MIIKEIFEKLVSATNPVARSYHKDGTKSILFIGFNKGMILARHKTDEPAKLLVLKGAVTYKESGKEVFLDLYDEYEIPVHILHEVTAHEDSLCMLLKSNNHKNPLQ